MTRIHYVTGMGAGLFAHSRMGFGLFYYSRRHRSKNVGPLQVKESHWRSAQEHAPARCTG